MVDSSSVKNFFGCWFDIFDYRIVSWGWNFGYIMGLFDVVKGGINYVGRLGLFYKML